MIFYVLPPPNTNRTKSSLSPLQILHMLSFRDVEWHTHTWVFNISIVWKQTIFSDFHCLLYSVNCVSYYRENMQQYGTHRSMDILFDYLSFGWFVYVKCRQVTINTARSFCLPFVLDLYIYTQWIEYLAVTRKSVYCSLYTT